MTIFSTNFGGMAPMPSPLATPMCVSHVAVKMCNL